MFSEFSLPKLVPAGDEVDFVSYSVGNHEARSFLGLMTWPYMSLVMRKPAFCIYENKDADQLRSHCAADRRLRFRYTDGTI